MNYAKQLALELQELLGDEFKVHACMVDYKWEAIDITKGPQNIQMGFNGYEEIPD